MTKGHKKKLFVLALSFFDWGILCFITFGIASIWVVPYINTTYANAYQSLKPDIQAEEQPVFETSVAE